MFFLRYEMLKHECEVFIWIWFYFHCDPRCL